MGAYRYPVRASGRLILARELIEDRRPWDAGDWQLGGVVRFRQAGVPQFLLLLIAEVPGQEPLDVCRNLAPGRRALLEVPRQPFPGIELPQRQRGKDREHRRRLLAAP